MPLLADIPIQRSTLPPGDASVDTTVAKMAELAMGQYGARSPKIRHLAIDIVNRAGAANKDYRAMAVACYRWVRDNIRYVRDPVGQEALCHPEYLLQVAGGDCDDMSMLVAALCGSLGIQTRFVTVAVNSQQFGHVYLEAEAAPGNWLPLDPIMREHGEGWEVPNPTRRKVYGVNGPDGLSGLGRITSLGDLSMDGSIFDTPVGSNDGRPFVGDPRQVQPFLRKPIPGTPSGPTFFRTDAADGGASAMDTQLRAQVNEPLYGLEGLKGLLRPAMPMGNIQQRPIRPVTTIGDVGHMGADAMFGKTPRLRPASSPVRGIDTNPLTQPAMARRTVGVPIQGLGAVTTGGAILDRVGPTLKKSGLFGLGAVTEPNNLVIGAIALAGVYLLMKRK